MEGNRRNGYYLDYEEFADTWRFSSNRSLKPVISLLEGAPRIVIRSEAFKKMRYIVNQSREEVSWLGTVTCENGQYIIDEIFILRQTVSSARTTMDSESIAEFYDEILSEPDGVAKANSIRFWGHSHVHMSVEPSGHYHAEGSGDLATMKIFAENGADFFIMGIANKFGEIKFDLFLYNQGIRIEEVPWSVEEEVDEVLSQEVAEELKQKVVSVPHRKVRRKIQTRGVIPLIEEDWEDTENVERQDRRRRFRRNF